jgi:hypothetical protein
MGLRPSSELIQSLRVTFLKIEENFALPEDGSVIAELKRILLLRIADIEAVEALNASEAAPEPKGAGIEPRPVEPVVVQSPDQVSHPIRAD